MQPGEEFLTGVEASFEDQHRSGPVDKGLGFRSRLRSDAIEPTGESHSTLHPELFTVRSSVSEPLAQICQLDTYDRLPPSVPDAGDSAHVRSWV